MSRIPFSDPPYLTGTPNPHYKATHLKFQKTCRQFMEKNLLPFVVQYEEQDYVPPSLAKTFIEANMLVALMATPLPCDILNKNGIFDVLGTPIEELDTLHGVICQDEMLRSGIQGPLGMIAGFTIGTPYLVRFGSQEIQDRFLPEILSGRKKFCIAMSEPNAGSDATNIVTKAVRSADGKEWIITGEKKWISTSYEADYTMMGVRTGGPGAKGISIIVVPLKNTPGLTVDRIIMSGQITGNHGHIKLHNVRVPIGNLIGEENKGIGYFVSNINHERILLGVTTARMARVALSTAFQYCLKREAYGKTLMEQPVVRHRFAKAGAQLESLWSWIEDIAYQAANLSSEEVDSVSGGSICLLKAQAGIVFHECAQVAALVMGGVAYGRNESGAIIEKLWREVNGQRVPGGSEDVMLDQGIRQMVKRYERGSNNDTKVSRL